ncbi:MAG: ribosome silencing factor [Alphaproteobacteria bacterium]|nr:MAG: ribosome silencing factor [Alphaproteobacteria bacterium]
MPKAKPGGPFAGSDIARLYQVIQQALDDGKAEDIVTIDLRGKSTIADFMAIASGRSQRQVTALAERVLRALKDAGLGTAKVEGLAAGDWVLIDAGDAIVHLFRPQVRAFYDLEKMWSLDLAPGGGQAAGN